MPSSAGVGSEVPPLNNRRGPSVKPLNRASRVQHTQKPTGQAIAGRLIVKAAGDAAQLAGGHQPPKCLVDRVPGAKIEKVAWCPDRAGTAFATRVRIGDLMLVYTYFGQKTFTECLDRGKIDGAEVIKPDGTIYIARTSGIILGRP